MVALMSYLGLGGRPAAKEGPSPVRALPASWFNSPEFYQLERRAIFSRKWMMITHSMRLPNAGDWLKFEVAGFEFVLCHDRSGKINGFHNVCRHRAFGLVTEDAGTSRIFSCRYHGWSYGLDGKLAKAPKYDEFPGFDKTQNNLFPIHVHVDVSKFIWVNLDSSETPEVAWEDDFENIDKQERYKQYNFDDYELDHTYELTGPFNWKILADNFNECYHCPTSHPKISSGEFADLDTHDVSTGHAYIKHQSKPNESQAEAGLGIASTYYFPNVSLSVLPHFIMLQRFLPSGPSQSKMQYQIFRNKKATEQQFQTVHQMYAQIMSEDKALCESVQRNLNAGIYVTGELHTRLEKGPLYFQKVTRETIWEHVQKERAAKQEIWPARQKIKSDAGFSKEDEDLCTGLACQTNQEAVAW